MFDGKKIERLVMGRIKAAAQRAQKEYDVESASLEKKQKDYIAEIEDQHNKEQAALVEQCVLRAFSFMQTFSHEKK